MPIGVGARLREERSRLGLNQTGFAALAGTTKTTQIGYEKEAVYPDAAYLAAIAAAGADIAYIVTGRRGLAPGPALDARALEEAVVYVEQRLAVQGKRMNPADKARAIRLAYELALAERAAVAPQPQNTELSRE